MKHYLETHCRSQKVYLEFPVLRLLCDVQIIQQIRGKASMFCSWKVPGKLSFSPPGMASLLLCLLF